MNEVLSIDLEVSLRDGHPRPMRLRAPGDAPVGDALDVLGRRLGLDAAAGAVQARSSLSGTWLDRAARLADVDLLRGERLSLVVGLAPAGPTGRLARWPDRRAGDAEGRVAVNRPPRSVRAEPTLTVPVPQRQTTRSARRFPLGSMLIPLLLGVALVLVVRRWEILLFALFTPVMVLWNHLEERRARRDEIREYGRTYDEEVAETLERIGDVRREWATWLGQHHPPPPAVLEIAATLGPRLWERQPGDPDFLRVRVGLATRRAPVTLRDDGGDSTRSAERRQQFEDEARADEVPATVDLLGDGPLAVLGPAASSSPAVAQMIAQLIAQLTTLHTPADVVLAAAVADRSTADWVRWLPHLADGRLATAPLATDRADAEALLAAVADLGQDRRLARESRTAARGHEPVLVVLVDGGLGLDPAALGAVADLGDVGITVIWFGDDARAVPTTAPSLFDLRSAEATLVAHRGGDRLTVRPDDVALAAMRDLSAALAPTRDAADSFRVRSIPERVSLADLVDDVASPTAVRRRWTEASATGLVARIGTAVAGPVDLDLGPQGSHVLVGGTTGSGKSELLQAMVASIAARYPPHRAGLLFVDYKGGAAFKDAMRLPHCVGVVTDLDAHLTRRVLVALDAEIRRREEVLARAGARDLTELRRSSAQSPADLVIVVDEFAALAKEIPEFVEGVVDVAARGRSLGLRLVLATQRPAGVINDRIRANVGARIALRVNDEADSVDVIGVRDAAHVPASIPGRAFLAVERSVIQFQSAWAGGPEAGVAAATIEAEDLDADRPAPSAAGGRTVLEAVVSACNQVMRIGDWPRPHVPWLPAIAPVVTWPELRDRVPDPGADLALFALADLPRQQAQQVVALDLERHQNLLVFGTSRSGKTTTLRTIAAALVSTHGPDRIHLYGLDFAGQGLRVLADAPHCAGVVGPDEPGRLARMLRRLGSIVTERAGLVATHGASGFVDLNRRLPTPLPRVVVLLDSYAGATAALERVDGGRLLERLERMIPDGAAVGVHVIVTADRRASVPSALTSVMTTRLVLQMAERDDYALLGVASDVAADARLVPGRGFIQGRTEVQVAVMADADLDVERRALAGLMRTFPADAPGRPAPVVALPHDVLVESLPDPQRPLSLPVALGDDEVRPVVLDLTDAHALVAGPPRSGRTTTLATIAAAAARSAEPPALVLVSGRRSVLAAARPWDLTPVDGTDAADLDRGLAEIDLLVGGGRTVLCLCDDVDILPDAASAALESLARRGRDEPIRIVAAADNRWSLRAYGGLVPEVRRSKVGVLLAPEADLDGDIFGVRLRSGTEPLGSAGRGFLVSGGMAELVQMARPDTSVVEGSERR